MSRKAKMQEHTDRNNCLNKYRRRVQEYYDIVTPAFMESFPDIGTSLQAALINTNKKISPKISNLFFLVKQAGIRSGEKVLDAGCGICGPSIDIADCIENIKIFSLTISGKQAVIALNLIQRNQLEENIIPLCGDFHELPFPDQFFDVVFFLESASYSDDLEQLFTSAYRVLKPSGRIYVKDFFVLPKELSNRNLETLNQFNHVFASCGGTLDEMINALRKCGFNNIKARDISQIISDNHTRKILYKQDHGFWVPTKSCGKQMKDLVGGSPPLIPADIIAWKSKQ